ncbi:MAG: formate dehydrogenase subunit gamma [Bordetella sp. SCN 67-23]|nr:MAG: formate dehydrogenase subunit gamma [Bordetella sp. SCN 67-23]ODU85786.1 MAG: formate dehydrogenase subunit gamma [Bordetella sp. SCN 68-11]OJW88927.1 MAG: formate dehydrogenase subunit gamma [Burkholderiales bacterium 67-32]
MPDAQQAAVEAAIASHRGMPGALLPLLHAIQDIAGCIPEGAVPLIADGLNLSRAEVHGVITYYHDFRLHPAGARTVRICRAEACQARGSEALAAHAVNALSCNFHETTADGQVTLEAAYCLGHCSVGPNIAIGQRQYARVTPSRFDALMATTRGAS